MKVDNARLVAGLSALKAARRQLDGDDPRGLASLQRVAGSLRDHAALCGDTELAESAESVLGSAPGRLEPILEFLLTQLRRRLHPPKLTEGGKLLIVAEAPSDRERIRKDLGSLSARTSECATPAEAWAVVDRETMAGMVLDASSNSDEVRTFLARVQADPTLRDVPIVVVSSHDSAAEQSECLALGAREFFQKPVTAERLLASVGTFLGTDERLFLRPNLDPRTGLPPAEALLSAARRMQHTAEVSHQAYCLVLMSAEDPNTLSLLARTVQTELDRDGCHAFAWEDELIAILFPNTTAAAATAKVQRVQRAARALDVTSAAGGVELLGMSVDRAIVSAQRMWDLARMAGTDPVITALSEAAPPRHRVLVAEDDRTVGEIVVRTLERAGLDAVLREDGLSALQAAEEMRFDLVVTDIVMPFMDGLAMLERLREMPRYKRTPILVLTSLGSERHIVQGFENGADAYLTKPFNPKVLSARVKSLLAKSAG